MLRNVELGHDLEPRHDGQPYPAGQLQVAAQVAVNTQPHPNRSRRLEGLNVNVGGAQVNGVADESIDHTHQGVV